MARCRPYYHEFAWAYDLLQTEDVSARVDFLQAALARYGIGAGCSALDAGCGTGRYAVELARRGLRVCGVDQSAELVAVARKRAGSGDGVPFAVGDLLSLSFRKSFDFVLCRGVLNDLVADAAREEIFRQFAAWLRPGGILTFDARDWARTVARYSENAIHETTVSLDDGLLRFRSETVLSHDAGEMLVHERFELKRGTDVRTTENEFVMRPWKEREIAARLEANGLEQITVTGRYGLADSWTDRLVVTARKAA